MAIDFARILQLGGPHPFDFIGAGIDSARSNRRQNQLVALQQAASERADERLQMEQQEFDVRQRAREAQLAQQTSFQEEANAMQAELQQALLDGELSPRESIRLVSRYPNASKAFESQLGSIEESQKQAFIDQTLERSNAFASGDKDRAIRVLERQKDSFEGAPGNEENVKALEGMIDTVKNTENGMRVLGASTNMVLARNWPKFAENLQKIEQVQQKRDEAPLNLAKIAADVKLTKAKVSKVWAENRVLGNKAKKAIAEMKAIQEGKVIGNPERVFKNEMALRKEYEKSVGDFIKVQDSYRKVESADDTAAGDLSLIFSYMKMLDPGSVVREGEFANAQNATGVPGKIRNAYNRTINGKRLNPTQRKEFKSQSKRLFGAAKKRDDEVRTKLTKTIDDFGLSRERVLGEAPEAPTADAQPEVAQNQTQQQSAKSLADSLVGL